MSVLCASLSGFLRCLLHTQLITFFFFFFNLLLFKNTSKAFVLYIFLQVSLLLVVLVPLVMDSSKVFGGAEECQSNESGWTMYIGDAAAATTDDGDDDGSDHDGTMNANHEDDYSDDSMASDASSGPSHHHYGTAEALSRPIKEADEDDNSKCTAGSDKKAKRIMEKQKAEMRRKEQEKDHQEMMLMSRRVITPAQSDSKARKNVWNMTKRK